MSPELRGPRTVLAALALYIGASACSAEDNNSPMMPAVELIERIDAASGAVILSDLAECPKVEPDQKSNVFSMLPWTLPRDLVALTFIPTTNVNQPDTMALHTTRITDAFNVTTTDSVVLCGSDLGIGIGEPYTGVMLVSVDNPETVIVQG